MMFKTRETSAMVRMTHWMGMLLAVCTSSGCAQQIFDCIDSACYQIKCEHQAKAAWMDVRDLYGGVSFPYNFGEGFRDGFEAVCLGNDTGCAPPMPPRRYWSSCYLDCEGKARTMAWYDGYAHGVLAASCSGCCSGGQVATAGVAAGSGQLGSALKGYDPPAPNPYAEQLGLGGHGEKGEGPVPTPLDGQPVPPLDEPLLAPPAREPDEEFFPGDEGEIAPEAPAVLRERELPHLPAAEIYRAPVF